MKSLQNVHETFGSVLIAIFGAKEKNVELPVCTCSDSDRIAASACNSSHILGPQEPKQHRDKEDDEEHDSDDDDVDDEKHHNIQEHNATPMSPDKKLGASCSQQTPVRSHCQCRPIGAVHQPNPQTRYFEVSCNVQGGEGLNSKSVLCQF